MTVPGGDEAWRWLKTAPLPVVLTLVLGLAAWVYAIDGSQKVERVKADSVAVEVAKLGTKMDKVLEVVAELRAEQRASRYRTPAPAASPAPKEK